MVDGIATTMTPGKYIATDGIRSELLKNARTSVMYFPLRDQGWTPGPGEETIIKQEDRLIDVTDEGVEENQQVLWMLYPGVRFILKWRSDRNYVTIQSVGSSLYAGQYRFTEGDSPTSPPTPLGG